jgi:uncharacterized membrane protein YkvA (DUF1232 family)
VRPQPANRSDPEPSPRRFRARIAALRRDTLALYLAARDPIVPWPARLVIGLVVAYALSPIDLIPDFIPVLGHLDDLLIVPAGLAFAVRLVPAEALERHRLEAERRFAEKRPAGRPGALFVLVLWGALLAWLAVTMVRIARG